MPTPERPKTLARLLMPLGLMAATAGPLSAQTLPPETAATTAATPAALRLAQVFGDGMVLQRDRPIPVWGWGRPGQAVQVSLGPQSAQGRVGEDGAWRVTLPPQPAGGPTTLRLTGGDGTLRSVQGVMVGDVWLLSGQSNMEWPLANTDGAAAEVAQAGRYPDIRHLRVPLKAALQPQADSPAAPWQAASPATAGAFSGIGWHFATRWQAAHPGVAVGLINTAWGGSMLETWVRRELALADPDLGPATRALPADAATYHAQRLAKVLDAVQRWQPGLALPPTDVARWSQPAFDDSAWPTLRVPELWEGQGLTDLDGVVWLRRRFALSAEQAAAPGAALRLAKVDDCDEVWFNGQRIGGLCGYDQPRAYPLPAGLLRAGENVVAVRVTDITGGGGLYGAAADVRLDTAVGSVPLAERWQARVERAVTAAEPTANDAPTLAHNALHHPLQGLPLRGVLWYQGESNVMRAAAHEGLFQRFITDWRTQWGQPALPFFWVQLAAFRPLQDNDLQRSPWAELRDTQRAALALPHTGMAVATDVGDADDIHPRDKRSVGARLAALALHDEDPTRPPATGPQLVEAKAESGTLVTRWRHVGAGLATRPAGAPLQGFAVAGADGLYRPAQARIVGQTVVLSHPDIAEPRTLRYGWVDNPSAANLVDSAGLPASPLRTDTLPFATRDARYGR